MEVNQGNALARSPAPSVEQVASAGSGESVANVEVPGSAGRGRVAVSPGTDQSRRPAAVRLEEPWEVVPGDARGLVVASPRSRIDDATALRYRGFQDHARRRNCRTLANLPRVPRKPSGRKRNRRDDAGLHGEVRIGARGPEISLAV